MLDWVLRNKARLANAAILVHLIAIVVDLILVGCGLTSISMRTWIATRHHPTLIIAGVLLTAFICYFASDEWVPCSLMAFMGGRLYAHW
jgi:hypothetical protein